MLNQIIVVYLFIFSYGFEKIVGETIGIKDVETDCEVQDNEWYGDFSSPNYPNVYPNNARCTWTITVYTGYKVQVSFDPLFNIEKSPNCIRDYVELRDGGLSNSTLLGRFCGTVAPSPIISNSEKFRIHFRSDGFDVFAGFSAMYETLGIYDTTTLSETTPEPTAEPDTTSTSDSTATTDPTATPDPTSTSDSTATTDPTSTSDSTATTDPTSTSDSTATTDPTSTSDSTATTDPTSTSDSTAIPETTSTSDSTATTETTSTSDSTTTAEPSKPPEPPGSSAKISQCEVAISTLALFVSIMSVLSRL